MQLTISEIPYAVGIGQLEAKAESGQKWVRRATGGWKLKGGVLGGKFKTLLTLILEEMVTLMENKHDSHAQTVEDMHEIN